MSFGDAYRRVKTEIETAEARRLNERSWQDLGAWLDAMVISHTPPQDAPALGYMPSEREYVGAVDATPPTVTLPDPIADLVKAYRLIRDHPEYP